MLWLIFLPLEISNPKPNQKIVTRYYGYTIGHPLVWSLLVLRTANKCSPLLKLVTMFTRTIDNFKVVWISDPNLDVSLHGTPTFECVWLGVDIRSDTPKNTCLKHWIEVLWIFISISIFNIIVEGLYDHFRNGKNKILNTMIKSKILLRA
jgi:hypothetical protein